MYSSGNVGGASYLNKPRGEGHEGLLRAGMRRVVDSQTPPVSASSKFLRTATSCVHVTRIRCIPFCEFYPPTDERNLP